MLSIVNIVYVHEYTHTHTHTCAGAYYSTMIHISFRGFLNPIESILSDCFFVVKGTKRERNRERESEIKRGKKQKG